MNVFFASIFNSIKRYLRDVTPFFMQVVGPIFMVAILASVMQSNFSSSGKISPVKATIVNEDSGQAAKELVAFLSGSGSNKLVSVSNSADISDARQLLREGKCDAVIEIQNGYSAGYAQGNYNGIRAYMISGDKTSYQIIGSILNGWENDNAAIRIALQNGQTMDAAAKALNNTGSLVRDMPLSAGKPLPKSIDYYSVTLAVMTLIFTGYLALGKIQDDFLSGMKNRFLVSPARLGIILTGDIIGTTIMGFLQSVVFMLFTHFVYGANWGSNWGVVLGTLFLMTLFGQMLAAAMTLGMNNPSAAQGIIGALALGFTFISGGFFASPIGGAVGKFLSTYGTPNSLAQTAIFGSVYGGSLQIIFLCMAVLAALSLALLGLRSCLPEGGLYDII